MVPDMARWTVSTLAGSGAKGFADGARAAAQFKYPHALAPLPDGSIVVAGTVADSAQLAGVAGVGGAHPTLRSMLDATLRNMSPLEKARFAANLQNTRADARALRADSRVNTADMVAGAHDELMGPFVNDEPNADGGAAAALSAAERDPYDRRAAFEIHGQGRPGQEQGGQGGRPSVSAGAASRYLTTQLYVAAGISGAIQHRAGMQTSKTIVAVNKDEEAPIFELVDFGVVGDLQTVLPAATEQIEKRKN
jgi:hypothetical protein